MTDRGWELLHAFGPRHKRDGALVKRITFVIGRDGRLKLAYWYDGRGDVTDHVTAALQAVAD